MNTPDALALVKPAVARVADAEESASRWLGTAFYIGDGYALSALHVVAAVEGTAVTPRAASLKLEFLDASHACTAQIAAHDVANDWVVLRCDAPWPAVTPIPCGLPATRGDFWLTYGYPTIARNGLVFDGRVIDADGRDPLEPGGSVRALVLYAEQAAAGLGAPMHGFSGAPCIVGGRAVGVMRSVLSGTALDGRGGAQPTTVAGTGYACPAWVIVGAESGQAAMPALPGGWSRAQRTSDFVVVLGGTRAPAHERLLQVARQARERVPRLALQPPLGVDATASVSSAEDLADAVRLLCRARVVVFNVTGFPPAVMLLLGIRAAVRRGVTILSIGGSYKLGDPLDMPFNLQDANIVSHSSVQEAVPDKARMAPIPLLAARIARGLEAVDSPFHFDLPVYEAVRRLPADRRGIRPADSGVLVLCPFDDAYVQLNWQQRLQPALENQLERLRVQLDPADLAKDPLGVARSFELNSPQLISRAIYEEMRRAQCCVVDLTHWRHTVLFELGVRLAVSPHPTACVIEAGHAATTTDSGALNLLQLLVPQALRYDNTVDWVSEQATAYAAAYGPDAALPRGGIAGDALYGWVERYLDVDHEPASQPVYRELLNSSQLYARQTLRGGKTKPVGLYPAHRLLTDREEQADFDRLLAAALFIIHRHGEAAALAPGSELRRALRDALQPLYERHGPREKLLEPALREQLGQLMDALE